MISSFRGLYHFCSNFYLIQQKASYGGIIVEYPSNEHFFAANKTLNWEQHIAISKAASPAIAKWMGGPRGYKMPDGTLFKIQLRPDWDEINIGIMKIGIDAKFGQNPPIQQMLIQTYPHILSEGNTWHDNFWGNCTCARCLHIPGQDFLGQLLMAYRSTLM